MKVSGKCHCGSVTFTADVNPKNVLICHCTDCQVMSGSAYRIIAMAPRETFHLLSGKPKIYVKTAESGARRVQAFCPNCGTGLYATSDEAEPKVYGLRAAVLAERDKLPPQKQIWTRSARHWASDLSQVEGFAKQPR